MKELASNEKETPATASLITRQELDASISALAREKGDATIFMLSDRIKNLAAAGGGIIELFSFGYDDGESIYSNRAVLDWGNKTWVRENGWLYRLTHSSNKSDYSCFPIEALPLWQRHVLSELKRLGYQMTCSVGNNQASIALLV